MADETSEAKLRTFHVLMMAVTDLEVEAIDQEEAIAIASRTAETVIELPKVQWVPRYVSDRPFEIAEPGEQEPSGIEVISPKIIG